MHMGLTFHHRFRLSHKNCYNANSNCEGKYTRSVVIINALVWIRFSVLLLSLKKPWENKGIEWSKLEMMEGRGPAHKLLLSCCPRWERERLAWQGCWEPAPGSLRAWLLLWEALLLQSLEGAAGALFVNL